MPERIVTNATMQQLITRGGTRDMPERGGRPFTRGRTDMVLRRYRSGSVTNYHMHGDGVGAITHTDRNHVTHRMNARDHDDTTRQLTRTMHGH